MNQQTLRFDETRFRLTNVPLVHCPRCWRTFSKALDVLDVEAVREWGHCTKCESLDAEEVF